MARLQLRYDRELAADELERLVTEHPGQVHRVPGCEQGRAFRFTVVAEPWGGRSVSVREFCICAKTLEQATDAAERLLEAIGKELD